MDFESPLGKSFTIGNLTDESANRVDFSKTLTNTEKLTILKKIYLDDTLADGHANATEQNDLREALDAVHQEIAQIESTQQVHHVWLI